MWRFRLGDPVTSAVTDTIEATGAQVTEAGLVVTLDEWGGCKSATWTGLTGGREDRTRVWIDVWRQDGTWRAVFSGALIQRPSAPAGEWEAVGDKYLRLGELPTQREVSAGADAESFSLRPGLDVGQAMRDLVEDARADLPHLVVGPAAPDANVLGKRRHNGESVAAALDGLISLKPGWGWTTLPDDTFYVGPAASGVAVVEAAVPGTQLALRTVISEGMRNAILWRYPLGERTVTHESRHASTQTKGRSSASRRIDSRALDAVVENVPVTYHEKPYGQGEVAVWYPTFFLRDGQAHATYLALTEGFRAQLGEGADWTEVRVQPLEGTDVIVSWTDGAVSGQTTVTGTAWQTLYLPALAAGGEVRVAPSAQPASGAPGLSELNPRRLRRDLLDAAATDLYKIPADHAGTASVLGIQDPVGRATVRRPGKPDFTERVIGTRYLVRQPMRTEYLIGEPEETKDEQITAILIDRRDEQAVDQAVNTVGAG